MTIATELAARVPSDMLVQLTNQGDPSATTVNTSVRDAAIADASAEFELLTGLDLDETDTLHVAAMMTGVLCYLHEYRASEREHGERLRQRWERTLVQIAHARGSRRRVQPATSLTGLEPSTEDTGTRPDHDRARYNDYVPKAPGAGSAAEDDDRR